MTRPAPSPPAGEPAPPAPAGVHHVALKVADLAAAERFYAGLLRLEVVRRWPRRDGPGERAVWLALGGGAVLALEAVAPGGAPVVETEDRPGYVLLALRIARSERAAWARRLAAAGHPVHGRTPFTLYARDPEGNRVGLSHFPDPAEDDADREV
jgi:hypothetical protein